MARPLRIEFSGAIYHVTSRGNAREDIWLDDTDRAMFLGVLAKVISRFNWRCHAYCLMDNHYHLLIETLEPNLSKGMRQLNGVYTQRFNRRHGRVGHVFQGRYKAILVERDSYLKELALRGAQSGAGETGTASGRVAVEQLCHDGRQGGVSGMAFDRLAARSIWFAAEKSAKRLCTLCRGRPRAAEPLDESPTADLPGQRRVHRAPAEQASRRERVLRGSESPAPHHPQPAVV